jgi:hypothetical protein
VRQLYNQKYLETNGNNRTKANLALGRVRVRVHKFAVPEANKKRHTTA